MLFPSWGSLSAKIDYYKRVNYLKPEALQAGMGSGTAGYLELIGQQSKTG